MPNKYGVLIRAIPHSDNIIIIQTVKRPGSPRYVLDYTQEDGKLRGVARGLDDNMGIADAIRRALKGELKRK